MKRIIFLLILVLLAGGFNYADAKRIKKVGENHVEVTPQMKVIDINGNVVDVYNEERKVSFGDIVLFRQKIKADKYLEYAKNLDAQLYKETLIALRQKDVDKIPALQIIIPVKTVTDINGLEIQVFDPAGSEVYAELINNILSYKKLFEEAQNLNEVQYKKDLVEKAQEWVDDLNLIQVEMDK